MPERNPKLISRFLVRGIIILFIYHRSKINTVFTLQANDRNKNYQMLIDGEWTCASDGKTHNSINPATGEVWVRMPKQPEQSTSRTLNE